MEEVACNRAPTVDLNGSCCQHALQQERSLRFGVFWMEISVLGVNCAFGKDLGSTVHAIASWPDPTCYLVKFRAANDGRLRSPVHKHKSHQLAPLAWRVDIMVIENGPHLHWGAEDSIDPKRTPFVPEHPLQSRFATTERHAPGPEVRRSSEPQNDDAAKGSWNSGSRCTDVCRYRKLSVPTVNARCPQRN